MPLASSSYVWRWSGWDNCRLTWALGRPSPTWTHARSGRDRSGRVPTDWLWSRFHPRNSSRSAGTGRELHICSLCPTFVDHGFPGRLDLKPPLFCGRASPAKLDHKRSRRHPAAAVSPKTGVPPRRGRHSAQPRHSSVIPTRSSPRVWVRREQVERTGGPDMYPTGFRHESGTARQAAFA
jgi:hypothetical protein